MTHSWQDELDLDAGWGVGGGLNGGYLLREVGGAISRGLPHHPDPVAVSAYFTSAGRPGPGRVEVRVVRAGRSTTTVAAELWQEGEVRISLLATFGDLSALPDDVRTTARPFEIPPPERCVANDLAPPEIRANAPLMERFEMRFDPARVGWAVGQPSGEGELSAWFRVHEGHEPDPLTLLLAVDALPPVTFDLGMPGWAPTMELTAHLRARPAPGWLRVRHRTSNMAGGMFEEDCEVWDSAGRLVAQARQLARVPRSA